MNRPDATIGGETRESFMDRVRTSLGTSRTTSLTADPPALDEAIVRLQHPGADLADVFCRRATAVGMRVHRTTPTDARGAIATLLRSAGARRLVSSLDASAATAPLHEHLRRESFELVDWKATPGFAPHYDADAGLTPVEAAVAESGTLVCRSGTGRGRALSLVPPVHIAVMHADQIVPDLIDFWRDVAANPRELLSSLVLITGPSKTADIEGVLITGVHGPREVHIVVIEP